MALHAPGACARTLPRAGGGSSSFLGCPIPHPPLPSGDDSLGTARVIQKIHEFYILISINHKHVYKKVYTQSQLKYMYYESEQQKKRNAK